MIFISKTHSKSTVKRALFSSPIGFWAVVEPNAEFSISPQIMHEARFFSLHMSRALAPLWLFLAPHAL